MIHRRLHVSRNSAAHTVLRALDTLGPGRHFLEDDLYPVYRKMAPTSRVNLSSLSEAAHNLDVHSLVLIRHGNDYATIELTPLGRYELGQLDNPTPVQHTSSTPAPLINIAPPRTLKPDFGADRPSPIVRSAHIRDGAHDHRMCPSRAGQHLTTYCPHI